MSESNPPETKTSAQDIPARTHEDVPSTSPVEMDRLKHASAEDAPAERLGSDASLGSGRLPRGPIRTDTTTALQQSQSPAPPPPVPSLSEMERTLSTAIGPSSDQPLPLPKDLDMTGPTLMITLLLTNGARHPFRLDGKYLTRRNVQAQGNDPFNLSVYKLKELILREWRDEWETKPTSPSAIRLISFGKLLDDKTAIKGISSHKQLLNWRNLC